MCFWSKSSADVLYWYVGKFWSYSHDSFLRHLKIRRTSQSTGKLNGGCCWNRPGMVVSMRSEGSWVGRDLEHVYQYEDGVNRELWSDYIELVKDICRTRIEIISQTVLGHSFMCRVCLVLPSLYSSDDQLPNFRQTLVQVQCNKTKLEVVIHLLCTVLGSGLSNFISTFQTPPPLFSTGMLRLTLPLPFTGVGVSATSLRLPHIFRITETG